MNSFRGIPDDKGAAIPAACQPDETLLAGLLGGDLDFSLAFARRFQSMVFDVAMSVLRDTASAEKVAQETFRQARKDAQMHDARRGSVRGWLAAIARSLAGGELQLRDAGAPDRRGREY